MPNPLTGLLIRYAQAARLAHGNAAAGAAALRLAARLSPGNPGVVRELAERERMRGEPATAEKRLRAALSENPSDLTLRAALASHLTRTGHAHEGLAMLERIVVDDANQLDARLELATTLAALGKFGDAEAHLLTVLDKRGADRELRGFHAFLLHRLKRDDEARAEFDRAFEGNAPSERCFSWKAIFHLDRGEKNAAADALRQGLDAHPRSTRLLGDYARFLSEQGGVKEAEDLLRKSLTIEPADPLALATLGSLLSRGESGEGDVYFRYALAIDPGHEAALSGIFKILEREGRVEEVLTIARAAAAHAATGGRALCLSANRIAAAGSKDEAKKILLTAAERSPNDPVVALTLADLILETEGNVKEADKWYARALENAIDEAGVVARVAASRLATGRADEADALAEKALTLDADSAAALSVRAGVLASRGKFDEALTVRRRTLQLDPENAAAHLDAGDLMARLERFEDAQIEIQIASRLNPMGNLLFDYATALLSQGRAAFGVAALADAVKRGTGGARGRFVYAHLLAAVGEAEAARAHLAAALEGAERQAIDSLPLREAREGLTDRGFARLAGGH